MRLELKFGDSVIELFVFGNGPKKLIAFHGFDNEAQEFEPLYTLLAEYTIISVNLYFHGGSFASSEHVQAGLNEANFIQLHKQIFERFPADQYDLIGYSLGGRIALWLYELQSKKIGKIILLAPDGLKPTGLYRFVTRNYFGKKLFQRVVTNPTRIIKLGELMVRFRMLPEKKLRFLKYNLENQMRRDKVYNTWMIYRFAIPNLPLIKSFLKAEEKKAYLFFGKWDVLMPPSLGNTFKKDVADNCEVNIIDTGHQLISEKNLKALAEILNRV